MSALARRPWVPATSEDLVQQVAAEAAATDATAARLAEELEERGLPVFRAGGVATTSHQLALRAGDWGGGQHAAERLRRANILTSGIGLPVEEVAGDVNGLRLGTPEIVRRGMTPDDMPALADLLARGLDMATEPEAVAAEVSAWRRGFTGVRFTVGSSLDEPLAGAAAGPFAGVRAQEPGATP